MNKARVVYKQGNLLEAPAEALVNTVNTVGVMGKGIALQFKEAFPENFRLYQHAVKRNEVKVGNMFIVPINNYAANKELRMIINFPTKIDWRAKSKMEYITSGLASLVETINALNIKSIAIPPLGSGNGGLNWLDVKPLIIKYLSHLDIDIMIFEPSLEVASTIAKETKPAKSEGLTVAKAMLLKMLYQYETLDEPISEFASVKLLYFLKQFGHPNLKLNYMAYHYGPYAQEVRHVLYALNGIYLTGNEFKNNKPFEPLFLKDGAIIDVNSFIDLHLSSTEKERLDNVLQFINGYENAYSLELLSTIDFIIRKELTFNLNAIIEHVRAWSDRKREIFDEDSISHALNHLKDWKAKLYPNLLTADPTL